MGFPHDIVTRHKKRCTICGCIMFDDSDSDICEICLDELYESDPGEQEDEESIDINHMWPKSNPYLDTDIAKYNYENRHGLGGLHTIGGSKC